MNEKLIYVVGPSGAGKDSLLIWLRAKLVAFNCIHFARRSVDRKATAQDEMQESLSTAQFQALLEAQEFALHWKANQHHYGIRHNQLTCLAEQHWIFVNGSRAHIPEAAKLYPGLTVLHITAEPEILEHRLRARARESQQAIEMRMQRSLEVDFQGAGQFLEVRNNDSMQSAGENLLQALSTLPDWPIASPNQLKG